MNVVERFGYTIEEAGKLTFAQYAMLMQSIKE